MDAFESDNDGEEDKYTTERILSDMPDPSTARGRIYKVRWKGFAALRDSWEPLSGFVPRYTSVWLDYVKAKNIKLDVKVVLVYMVRSDRNGDHHSLCMLFFCISIFFTAAMYIQWLRTAKVSSSLISLTGTKISLGLCSFFLSVHNRLPLAQEIPTEPCLSRPLHLSYLFRRSLR